MRFVLCFAFLSYSFALAESGEKRSYTREGYTGTLQGGATQSGAAQSNRQVDINDGPTQTNVGENYQRQHQYQTTAPSQPSTSGTYRQGGQAARIYYHHGDNATKAQIQAYETKRIGLLNQVDALYTRAERCKTTLNQNPQMTREERKSFEREIGLISYEIGRVGLQLGNVRFNTIHPDLNYDENLFAIGWSRNPYTYKAIYLEDRLKKVNWQLTYLGELQKSMATPYAQVPARNDRNIRAEIDEEIRDIREGQERRRLGR